MVSAAILLAQVSRVKIDPNKSMNSLAKAQHRIVRHSKVKQGREIAKAGQGKAERS